MSGMKFRVQCSSCGSTFFSPDRKARICPKCAKKKQMAAPVKESRPYNSSIPQLRSKPPAPKPPAPKIKKEPTRPKAIELSPEQESLLEKIYRDRFQDNSPPWAEMVKTISDELWVSRKVISEKLRAVVQPEVPITPELSAQIIERYKHYVEHGERPPEGRRKKIGVELQVPFRQVRSILYEWSISQFQQSPTPDLSRELRFEIEKLYTGELEAARVPLDDIPKKLAQDMGNVTSYQISRWLDMLHDDDSRFENIQDVSSEKEKEIIDAYRRYLNSPAPPQDGLHGTIADAIGGVTRRQVHKTLQKYRNRRRAEYAAR